MYGRVEGAMTESSRFNPSSVKGSVRAKVAEQLLAEMKAGNISASIARAPDFYGAESMNSFLDGMVLDKFSKKAKAMWVGNASTKHSFIYIPDAGKAVALLGANPDTDNQTWHLPTAPALTGLEIMNMAAGIFGTKSAFTRINKLMLKAIGLFDKKVGEIPELYYQYQYDYIFDSSKFEKRFQFKPTSYADGIRTLSTTMFKGKD
jgi:nucleoside-diphosphate-sugar epimerase